MVEAADEAIINGLGVGLRLDRDDALGFAAPSLLSVDLDGCPLSTEIKEEQIHRAFTAGKHTTTPLSTMSTTCLPHGPDHTIYATRNLKPET